MGAGPRKAELVSHSIYACVRLAVLLTSGAIRRAVSAAGESVSVRPRRVVVAMMVLRVNVFGKSVLQGGWFEGCRDDYLWRCWFVKPIAVSLVRKLFMRSHMCCWWWCEADGGLNLCASDQVGLGFGEHGDPSKASRTIDIGMLADVNVNL